MEFVESIQAEGVVLERKPMGEGTAANAPIVVEVDNDNKQKDLDKLDKERQELNAKARDLDKKRSEFITKKQAEDEKRRPADAFDTQVLQLLQRQAQRVQIDYALPPKKEKSFWLPTVLQ